MHPYWIHGKIIISNFFLMGKEGALIKVVGGYNNNPREVMLLKVITNQTKLKYFNFKRIKY